MQRIKLRNVVSFLLVTLAAISGLLAHAQGTSASLTGTVTDPSGAAVAGATVTVTNTGTNLAQSAKTNSIGVFVIRPLPIGTYSLTIAAPGFDRYMQTGIELTANLSATQDVTLRVGAGKAETISVTADAELINTSSAELGTTVGEAAISELPLNGRDPSSLVLLAPGTSNVRQHGGEGTQTGFSFDTETGASSNGGRQGSTYYMLDGVTNMDNYDLLTAPFPNADATQEFKVITNNFSAQYGFAPGAVVSIATKSGTNTFHGGAFWFVRNNDLNAGDWFSKSVDLLKRNQFGAFVGGPIKKDKLFFFGNYQGTKMAWGSSGALTTTPTQAMLTGDFSGLGADLSGPFKLNAATGKHDQLDTAIAHFDPMALTITKTGLPNSTKMLANSATLVTGAQRYNGDMYYTIPAVRNSYEEGTAKLDYILSPTQTLSLRSFTNYMTAPGTDVPGNIETAYNHQSWTANFWEQMYYFNDVMTHNWTINPTTVNTIAVFWNQMSAHNGAQELDSNSKPMCFSGYTSNISEMPNSCYMGALRVETGNSIESGWDEPSQEVRNTLGLVDTVAKQLGKHSLTAGMDLIHQQAVENTQWPTQPTIVFNGNYTGNALADFLLGYVHEYMQGAGEVSYVSGWQVGPFFQDDWKLRSNLTVNLGLRWDPNFAPTAKGGRGAAFVSGQQSTAFPNAPVGLIFPGDQGMTAGLMPNSYGYWEPRVGLAWQPKFLPKTVVHAGFGMFTGPLEYSMYNHASDIAPFSPTFDYYGWCSTCTADTSFASQSSTVNFSSPWANALSQTGFSSSPYPKTYAWASSLKKPASTFSFTNNGATIIPQVGMSFSRNFKLGVTQSWNLSIEEQVSPVMVVRAAYVGSESVHQTVAIDRNAFIDPDNNNHRDGHAPYSGFEQILEDDSSATASYHALELGFERKISHGIQMQSNFTWSHTIDLASGANVSYGTPALPNPFNLAWNRGNSGQDMPWNWVTNFIYQTPGLKNQNRVLHEVLGGWELSGIITAQTGNPFSIGADSNGPGQRAWGIGRANLVPGVATNMGKGNRQSWANGAGYFNTAAFCAPFTQPNWSQAVYTCTQDPTGFGDTGRNAYWGPHVLTSDMAVMKSWGLTEGSKLAFRWEAFNATNHPNFGIPGTIDWNHEGMIQGLGNVPARVMQGALKLTF
ncbi:MAG: carboxypeptidase regulatory-like domain-containing protein [Terracidiphilus sp.]